MDVPVIIDEADEAKKQTLVAISLSVAAFPKGILPNASFLNFLFLKKFLTIGVSTKVGATVLTLILFFGIEGLTKGMGGELAKNDIRVNTVAPTFVATPMVLNFFKNKKFKKLALGNIPMGKLATESDIATTVCFLASSASSMITGTSIVIDGGWTAQ